jgi:hypothetical protein
MYKNDGYSFYGQKMRPNLPNKNQYPNNYNNNYNNNNYQRSNNYPHFQNKNPIPNQNPNPNKYNNMNNMNNRPIMPPNNKKYADLEIRPFFRNDNNPSLSAKDLQMKQELDTITKQYMTIFNNINNLSNNSSDDNYNISNKLSKIKNELKQVDNFNGNKYSIFIGQLYEVSKDDKVLNLDYDSFKKNNREIDDQIKNVISNFKYDIVLFTNKNNITPQTYEKLNDYIKKKKQNNNNNTINNPSNQNNSNSNYYPSENLIDNDDDGGFNLLKTEVTQTNQKFEDPNDISDYNNLNSYFNNQNKNNSEPISVKFIIDGNEAFHEVKSNDSGEVLYLLAMQSKDDPKIYTMDGRNLTYDVLIRSKIGEIFGDFEPVLNIY